MTGDPARRLLDEVNQRLGSRWTITARLRGGWNDGAYLLRSPGGEQAVLKRTGLDLARLRRVAHAVARARDAGWPTPAWLAGSCCLQEYVPGRRPTVLDDHTAGRAVVLLQHQAGLGGVDTGVDWSAWTRGVVLDDWDRFRTAVAARFPHGRQLVDLADTIAARVADVDLPGGDLVHGNLDLANLLATEDGLVAVDVESLGAGTRGYDAAGLLLSAAGLGRTTRAGEQILWTYAATGAGDGAFALCLASIALTMAEAFIRHDCLALAPAAAPGMLRILTRAASVGGRAVDC